MNLRNILFRFRYWLKPNASKQLDKKLFAAWLNTLPDSHKFDMRRDDPISQFLRCTTRVMHVTVGLDWYSFEKPVLAKKLEPAGKLSDGSPYYCYADLWEKPLTECHGLPSWASTVMWDKKIGADFTKATLLKHHPKLLLA